MQTSKFFTLAAGFTGGVAFIIGCSGGGSVSTNSAIAADAFTVIEEMHCLIDTDNVGLAALKGNFSDSSGIVSVYNEANSFFQTIEERHPNHVVYCNNYSSSELVATTLADIYSDGWRINYSSNGSGLMRLAPSS